MQLRKKFSSENGSNKVNLLEEMIICRYVKFLQSIQKSEKLPVKFMLQKVYRNVNTITGRNVRFIQDKLGPSCVDILDASSTWMKKNIKFSEIRNEDKWRVDLLREITNINQQVLQFISEDSFLSSDQLQEIVDFVSTSWQLKVVYSYTYQYTYVNLS